MTTGSLLLMAAGILGGLAACGSDSSTSFRRAGGAGARAGEAYVNSRLASGQHGSSVSPGDVFTFCREQRWNALLCVATVTQPVAQTVVERQRWTVELDGRGHVTAGRRTDAIEARSRAGREPASDRSATKRRGRRSGAGRARRRTVRLTLRPRERTYVCVEDRARVLYDGVTNRTLHFRRPRLRLHLGLRTIAVRVDGRRIAIPTSPYALDIRPSGLRRVRTEATPCR